MTQNITVDPGEDWAVFERDGQRWRVDVDWGVFAGAVRPTRIAVGAERPNASGTGGWLTATAVRQIPLGEIVDALLRAGAPRRWSQRVQLAAADELQQLGDYFRDGGAAGKRLRDLYDSLEQTVDVAEDVAASLVGPRRGRSMERDELEALARVYRDARAEGSPVTAAVAARFHVSNSTAGKRIMAARRLLRQRGEDL